MSGAINWALYAPQFHFGIAIVALYVAVVVTKIYRRK